MPVATDAHISSDGDGLMHRHGPDPPTGPNPDPANRRGIACSPTTTEAG